MTRFWKRFSVADMILIIIGIAAIAVSALALWRRSDHAQVYIYKDNLLWGTYPADTDRTIVIDSHNTVRIQNGKAAVTKSDCPDKRCVKQGFSSHLPIICLPNDLVVEIKNDENDNRLILY